MEPWTGNIVRNWFNCLVSFGRIGYVAEKYNIKGKMKNDISLRLWLDMQKIQERNVLSAQS